MEGWRKCERRGNAGKVILHGLRARDRKKEEKILGKADCRKKNMCIFCKAWMGEPADTNFATGMSKFSNAKGMCKNDGEMHSPDGLCRDFEKNLLYL